MTTTATLVFAGHNRLRYLISTDGDGADGVTITSTGAATPDLLTDSLAGPLKNLAKAADDGFGLFAAGALTQAQARALWLSDWSTSAGNANTLTARCTITPRTGSDTIYWIVDANVSGGDPILTVTPGAGGTAGTVYLDIEVQNQIGV